MIKKQIVTEDQKEMFLLHWLQLTWLLCRVAKVAVHGRYVLLLHRPKMQLL